MRDGYGTVHLRGFDVDRIPSAPFNPHAMSQSNPQHLTLEDDSVVRRRRPEHVFNPETGVLRLDLWFNNPEKDDVKQLVNQTIRDARPRGLRRVVIIIAAETAAAVETYAFFSRNKFERGGFEPAGYLRYEKAVEKPSPAAAADDDEISRRANELKVRAEKARAEQARVEQAREVNQPTTVPNFLQRKYDEEMRRLSHQENKSVIRTPVPVMPTPPPLTRDAGTAHIASPRPRPVEDDDLIT